MSGVKTLSLIETEKLRNFQENLRALYDISEKYDALLEKYENMAPEKCTSCELLSTSSQKSAKNGKKKSLITHENKTEKDFANVRQIEELIDNQKSALKPNPENSSPSSSLSPELNEEWYQML